MEWQNEYSAYGEFIYLYILIATKTEIKVFCSVLHDWNGEKPEKRVIYVHKCKIS